MAELDDPRSAPPPDRTRSRPGRLEDPPDLDAPGRPGPGRSGIDDPAGLKDLPGPGGEAPAEPGEEGTSVIGRLAARLGGHRLLSRIPPASWSPERRGLAALIAALVILIALVAASFMFLAPDRGRSSQNQEILGSALDAAWNWVDGSEAAPILTKPPWLAELKGSGPQGADLARGVEEFLDFRFEEALKSFQKIQDPAEPDHRVLSLLAAANLRLLNYGQANLHYTQALSLAGTSPEKGGLKEASDRLGLALALFHQQDYDRSLSESGVSWRIRQGLLGPADSKTLAAANAMATSLMAMSRSAVAGDLLLEAVAEAIEDGADQNQPVLRDSLSILFLAFEAQGRGEELKALFKPPETAPEAAPDGQEPSPSAQAPVQAPSAAQAGDAPDSQASRPEPSTDQADPPEDRTPPEPPPEPGQAPTIDQKEARELIERLKAGHPGSRVLPALALALAGALTDQARPPCRSPYPAGHYDELLSLCLDVAKGYASVKELNESSVILDSLTRAGLTALAEKEDVSKPRLIEALALLASEREALNDPASAEAALRQAREVAAAMPKDDQQTLTSLIILSLRLSDVIIKQRRPPIEAELELVTGLTIIKKIFGARIIESHPLIPVIYLRLAWLVESLGRGKDAGAYRNQAGRSIKAVTKAHPEFKVTIDELNQAFEESRRGESSQDTLAHLWRSVLPADRPPLDPPSPELMRVELAALKLLNRLPEFRPLIDSAIQWSAGTHGPDSSTHRRYQSLNLKYLEESGDLPALLAALDGLAADPGTTKDPERTAIITAALKYKARVLEAAGRVNEALEALSQARMMLLSNQALINRLPEIEAEINRLNAAD